MKARLRFALRVWRSADVCLRSAHSDSRGEGDRPARGTVRESYQVWPGHAGCEPEAPAAHAAVRVSYVFIWS